MDSEQQCHFSSLRSLGDAKLKAASLFFMPICAQGSVAAIIPDPKKHLGPVVKIQISLEIPIPWFAAGQELASGKSDDTAETPGAG